MSELELEAMHFQHDKTGADYLHLAKDDKNNVFSIGFKTNPPDHTGVPHVLEHTTLCGSQKYPVRDPFFKMMPRSLNNFMNAMTYPEHTIYPFATTNHQDFRNLLSVYVDSTLNPLLRKHDFLQEGWRIGPEDPKEPISDSNKLQFKGIVYNEMKGNMSNADYLFQTRWQNSIFPDIQDSGGDPQRMTDLTHEQLTKFHADHYNPSNAKIVTYGDMPVDGHLQELASRLEAFSKGAVDGKLMTPNEIDEPRVVKVEGPSDPLYPRDEQYKVSLSWIMNETANIEETFALDIISSLLLDGFSAPLYENLIEIGWGASYSPNTGYDSSGKVGIFSVGLSGVKKGTLPLLNDGIRNTLASVRRKGFNQEKIEGRLHQLELALKHKTASFGMSLTSRLQDAWFNGTDPFRSVAPEEVISAFKEKNQDPNYLMDLFKKYWINDNTLTFIMEPSETFSAERDAEEAARFDSKLASINKQHGSPEAAAQHLAKEEMELLEVQESAQGADAGCLPTVHVQDIPRSIDRKELTHASVGETKVQWREAPTNGLTYFRAVQTLKDLPEELRLYLPLFISAIHRLGTTSLSTEALEDQIRLKTGGIALSHHLSPSPSDPNTFEEGIAYSATALDQNVPEMFSLLQQLARETNFDHRLVPEKLGELVKMTANTAVNDIADAGHAYARRFAEASISPSARLAEQTSGITQVRLMMDLAGRVGRDPLEDVIGKLKAIQALLLSDPSSLRVAITNTAASTSANTAALETFLASLPREPNAPSEPQPFTRSITKTILPLPYQVHYTAQSLLSVPYTHASSPALALLAQLLTHKRLHPEIREKGGAYGASCYANALRGTFGFATYRDPNPANSLKIMADAGGWAARREWSARELEEAKLSLFQSVDAPVGVADEGMTLFLTGIDEAARQARRERLLDVSAADVRAAAAEVVDGKLAAGEASAAVLGRKEAWMGGEWREAGLGTLGESAQEQEEGQEEGQEREAWNRGGVVVL